MNRHLPRIVLAGTSSGCGKTTAVCAVLSLLKRRGIDVSSCKCGPDYIDPMFHRSVIGVPTTNLDPFFCDSNLLQHLLAERNRALAVIEGVMGYYDGTGADGTENSTYTVARETHSPVILVVNGKGASASLLAVIEGFLRFRQDSGIAGVLFGQITESTYQHLKKLMDGYFGDRLRAVGYIPRLPAECLLESRHLGLVTAGEVAGLHEKLERLADLCENTIDLDALISVAEQAPPLEYDPISIPCFQPVRIAVAKDQAFCFYYQETLSLFQRMGAQLCYFSPLANDPVPDADGLYIGGGYPELYAAQLEENLISRESVRQAIRKDMPTIAECGGFQYLGSELEGRKMCGALPHSSFSQDKLVRFGYLRLTSRENGLFGPAGTVLRAHEFHYYDSTENGDGYTAEKSNGRQWQCAVSNDRLYAGYPHLYLYSNLDAAASFYQKCLKFKAGRNQYAHP